jgi:hypothetical protein
MRSVGLPSVAALCGALAVAFLALPVSQPAAEQPAVSQDRLAVHYVPTPQQVVDKMLEMAEVGKDDYVVDLGSGDGRIPITAAKKFGINAMGVDLDPQRISEAKANAVNARVADKVEFRNEDLFKTDFSKATVLTMYLLPSINRKLRPRILSELKPGTRVVSHAFDMGDWTPHKTAQVDGRTVYLWIVPEKGAVIGGDKQSTDG